VIGASGLAMGTVPAQAPSVQPAAAGTAAGHPVAAAETAPAPPTNETATVARAATAPAQSSDPKQPAASAQDDFALLLGNADTRTPVAVQANAAPEPRADDAAQDATSAGEAALPAQLLALLDGSWMQPAPAGPAAGAASPPAGANAAPAPSMLALRAPAIPAAGSSADAMAGAPALPADAASPTVVAIPDSAASFAEASATAMTADENTPLPGFPAIAAASPPAGTPSARAIPPATMTVPADPRAGFDDGFGARLVWMAEQRLGHAEIRLNPEHLGPIDVRLQVDGTQVSAEFHSGHAGVRQAIEASLPRLREMLGQQGLQLGQADVGQRHDPGPAHQAREDTDGNSPSAAPMSTPDSTRMLRSRGLLDEYA